MRNATSCTVLGEVPRPMLLAQWYCFWLAYTDGMQVASRAIGAAHAYADLSMERPHNQNGKYCTGPAVQYFFTVAELRLVFRGSQDTGDFAGVERLLHTSRIVFSCIVQRTPTISTSKGAPNSEPPVSSVSVAYTANEFHAFTIKHVALPGLEEVDQLQFYCKGREGDTVTALTCAPRPPTLPGTLTLCLECELLARKVAKRRSPWCRITHNAVSLSISSFLEAAVGLCMAFGDSSQLLSNENFAVVDLIPGLHRVGSAALGFQPQPPRYIQSPQSFFLARVKPTTDEPSDRGTDRGAAYFEGSHLLGFDSWFRVGVSRRFFEQAVQNMAEAFQAAVMTDGRTTVDNDCVMRIAVPQGHEELFRDAGGGACRSNRPFLTCVQAVQNEVSVKGETDALSMLLSEIKSLNPDVRPSSVRVLRLLSKPRAWRSLYALVGPKTARFFESPAQTAWYETMMKKDSLLVGSGTHANLHPSSERVASELFRFAIWYIDIFPSRRYWESLELGCIRKDLAYVNAMGKIRTRQPPHLPTLTKNNEQVTRALFSMLFSSSVTHKYEPVDASELGLQLSGDEDRRFTEETAIILPRGEEVRPLQSQYSFEQLRAISDLNPLERDSDGELRRRWLASPLFEEQGYLLITDVPARDGVLFDLKVYCSRTGRFRRTRLTAWFSDCLCEPDYVELPNNDVAAVWRKDNMPVNRMLGIEFESRPPWQCGVSFLGDERSPKETPVKGEHLITIMTGLCSLVGFKTGWVLDSVKDLCTNELLKITTVMERRVSFYENRGFLLSVNTLKSRRRAETCVGSSLAEFGPPLVGVCHQPHDILINPGFERTVLLTLATKAYDTLYRLTFDCNSSLWKNCAQQYPLSVVDHRGKGCAFERHPLYQELKYLKPDRCNLVKRVGDCHKFVRKNMKCDRVHKRGCKYLAFLYSTFLYPGGDIQQEVLSVIRDHFENVSLDLFQEGRRYVLHGINKAAAKRTDDLERQGREGTAQGDPPINLENEDLHSFRLQSLKQDESDTLQMQNMLLESVVFHDWTNTPQFWVRALCDYTSDKIRIPDATRMCCPVGYAWAYITRIQAQLYRRPSHITYRLL